MADIDTEMRLGGRVHTDDAGEAQAREQAAVELEKTLIGQEQELERGTGVPIVEQADGLDGADRSDGEDVITAGQGQGSQRGGMGEEGSELSIPSPGIGTDESERIVNEG
jgi:hypothetical protein